MTIDRLRALVSEDFNAVNHLIIDKIQSEIALVQDLAQHIINSGGKRLRPLLVLLSSSASGYQGKEHIALAAMIEFFHTATLLHDDVVDESTLRRGLKTANSIWGSKASVLVGDYLFTQSMQLIAAVGNLDILNLLANTSHQISCGEAKQLSYRHNLDLDMQDYFDVIRSKTALLFAAAAQIGPIISGTSQAVQEELYAYGLHLGNAFQLIDDALDYCSDAKTLGKNIGDDLADGKITLPLIHALKNGSSQQQNQIKDSLKSGSLDCLPEILKTLEETKALEFIKKTAAQEIDLALTALSILPDSQYKEGLSALAQFAIERSY